MRLTAGGVVLDGSSAGGWLGLTRRLAGGVAVTVAIAVAGRLAGGAETIFLFAHWVVVRLQACYRHVGWHGRQSRRLGRAMRRAPRRYLELIVERPELAAQGVIIAARDTVGHAQRLEYVGHIAALYRTRESGARSVNHRLLVEQRECVLCRCALPAPLRPDSLLPTA